MRTRRVIRRPKAEDIAPRVHVSPWPLRASERSHRPDFIPLDIKSMHRTGDAGIEGMDRAQDFERLLGIGHGIANERGLVGPPVNNRSNAALPST